MLSLFFIQQTPAFISLFYFIFFIYLFQNKGKIKFFQLSHLSFNFLNSEEIFVNLISKFLSELYLYFTCPDFSSPHSIFIKPRSWQFKSAISICFVLDLIHILICSAKFLTEYPCNEPHYVPSSRAHLRILAAGFSFLKIFKLFFKFTSSFTLRS